MENKSTAIDIIYRKMKELDAKDSYGIIIFANGIQLPVNKNFDILKEKIQAFADAVNSDPQYFDTIVNTQLNFIEVDGMLINPFGVHALIKLDKPVKRRLPFF